MGAGQNVSSVSRRKFVRRDIGTCEMLNKMVPEPLVEDIIVFPWGLSDVRVLHEGMGCQLFIIDRVNRLLDAFPTICGKKLPG